MKDFVFSVQIACQTHTGERIKQAIKESVIKRYKRYGKYE